MKFPVTPPLSLVTSKGVKLAFLAGTLSAAGSYLYFVMYQHKAPLTLGLPLLSVSTIIFSAIIGFIFFEEKVTLTKTVGLVLAAVSIFILGI